MIRLVFAFALFIAVAARAHADAPPINFSQPYSSDEVATDAHGGTHPGHMIASDGKMRMQVTGPQGMNMTILVRPDQQKVYLVMDAQKMAMQLPLNPKRYAAVMAVLDTSGGAFEKIGPDTVDGVGCTKYKVTDKDGKSLFAWGLPDGTPVKIAGLDGSYSMIWKNYKAGPQPAALFDIPADYNIMPMGGMPGQ
jgi:hypothetical protein